MNMTKRFFGRYPTIMGKGVIGTSKLNVYDLIQDLDWASIFSTAAALDISSSSANDAAAGTGARTVTVYGLDSAGKMQTETIALNGQTAVTTTKTFWRVFGIQVATAGTGRKNAGDIYAVKTTTSTWTAGVPDTLTSAAVKILAGENFGTSGMFTAPAGQFYSLSKLYVGARAQAGRLEVVHGDSKSSPVIYPYAALQIDTGLGSPGGITLLENSNTPNHTLLLRPLQDFYCRGTMAAASGIISFVAKFQGVDWRIDQNT